MNTMFPMIDDPMARATLNIVRGRDLAWLVSRQARRFGEKPFLIWAPFEGEHRSWTYAAFENEVRMVAAGLAAQGVKAGDRVLIHLENCPELLLSWFACAHLGATGILSNTRSVARDIAYFCELTEAVGAITQPSYAGMIALAASDLRFIAVTKTDAGEAAGRDLSVPRMIAFEALTREGSSCEDRPPATFEDASIQFTSGTTSRSKAVVWTHATILYGAQQTARTFGLRNDDTGHIVLPLCHIYGLSCFMGALWSGGVVLLQRKFSASNFWKPAVDYRATWAPMIPFFANALQTMDVPEHSFRMWNSAGKPEDIERFFGVETSTTSWGMTEIGWSPIVTDVHQPGDPDSICGSLLGRPAPGFLVSVRRGDGGECDVGETGTLFVKGIPGLTMFRTYLHDQKAFAESFDHNGWFDTGDLAYIGEGGGIYFADRAKDIIRVGAENVSAAEVEMVIYQTGWVRECAVVAGPHPMLDEVPVAFVTLSEDAPSDVGEQLIAHCRKHLADFKVIREVHIVDDFPRSTIEKIAKNVLRDRLKEGA